MYKKKSTIAEEHAAGVVAGVAFLNSDQAPPSFTYETRSAHRPFTVDGALALHETVLGAANYSSEFGPEEVLKKVVTTARAMMGWQPIGRPVRTGHNTVRVTLANPRPSQLVAV